MDFPFPNNAPAEAGAPTDDFWAFNPQQPPPMNAQADDTSLDELLALYQTAQDAPPAPFAPMGEPESYTGFEAAGAAFDAAPGADAFPAFDAAPGAADAFPAFDAAGPAFGDPATDAPFPAFGAETENFGGFGDAPAFPAFGDDAGAPAAFDAPPAVGGFDAAAPFDSSVPPFDPNAGGFDLGADPFAAPPAAAEAGGFGGFETVVPEAPAFGAFDAEPQELPADFGADLGSAFPAFDAAPAAEAPAADFGSFDAPAELPADFGGDMGAAFPAFDAPAAEAGPVFDAFPAAEEAAELPADFGADMGSAFPAFDAAPAEAPAAEFGSFDAPAELPADFGADMGNAFPAFDAPAADAGPVFDAFPAAEETTFPAFDATPAAPEPVATPAPEPAAAAGGSLFAEEEPMEFVMDEDAPLFPALDDAPVFPAFDAAPAAEVAPTPAPEPVAEIPAIPEGPVFPAFDEPAAAVEETTFPPIDDTPPVFAAPEPVVGHEVRAAQAEKAAPVMPAVDPEQTLRYREVPATPAASGPSLDLAALASLTGKEVVVKSAEDRRAANQQLTQVVGSLSTGLDDIQGRMAHLYADLQKAAVSRAPVDEIQQITQDLAKAKASVGEGSELYKQALFLRQMADAYLAMLKEL